MTFTYEVANLTTDLALVRLSIGDTEVNTPVFQDEELNAFLAVQGGSWRRAAAVALERIATSQILLLKVITILDVKTDGAAVAKALLAQAHQLRVDAAAAEDENGSTFEVIEMVTNDFGYRERIQDEYLRGS